MLKPHISHIFPTLPIRNCGVDFVLKKANMLVIHPSYPRHNDTTYYTKHQSTGS